MTQVTFSIRMDEETKQSMEKICESIGISMSSTFNVFARAFVRNSGFPFDVKLGSDDDAWDAFLEARNILRKKYLEEPSMDQIEQEIKTIRSRN